MFQTIREQIDTVFREDPAAKSVVEIFLCYPGFQAILLHRIAHRLYRWRLPLIPRVVSQMSRFFTGIEIHPGATIGRRVFIDHGMGVVVGETAEVGDECTIYQGVTLGGTSLTKGAKRHPTLGRGVIVGANSQVLGGFTVGDGARIGSSAVVVKPVPAGATAVGNPARIIQAAADATREATAAKMGFSAYGLTQGDDPVSLAMKGLIDNASGHEHQIALLWQAIEKLSSRTRELPSEDCVPGEAHTTETFDAERLNRLVK
jgi:serine O-acetyltransferase